MDSLPIKVRFMQKKASQGPCLIVKTPSAKKTHERNRPSNYRQKSMEGIEELRDELENAVNISGSLTDPKVLRASKKLDKLINSFYRTKK